MIRYHARWVVPVAAASIEDGTVGVNGDRIAYVGPRSEAPAGSDVDLGDAILMPGLVNAHTHLELTAMRGFLEDLEFPAWIARLTVARREVCTPEMLLDAARLGVDEGIRVGITTYADTCDSGVSLDAMAERSVRGVMYQEVFGPDPAQCAESLAGLQAKIDARRADTSSLLRIGVSPHAPFSVSDALFTATANYAREQALPIAIHIAESDAEQRLVTAAQGPFASFLRSRKIDVAPRGRTPVSMLQSLGVLDARPLLIHCVRVDQDDLSVIADSRCTVAHCPASNAKLGHGVAPLAAMMAAGIPVGVGSDSMASNNRMDILGEARLATLQQRALSARHSAVTLAQAVYLATLGGAQALGLDDEIGSLEVGKAADLAAFPISQWAAPTFSPEAAAIFALPGTPARLVTVAGRELVRDGRPVVEDAGLPGRVDRTAVALQAWAAARR